MDNNVAVRNEIVLQKSDKVTAKVVFNQNTDQIFDVKYEYKTAEGKKTADLTDASTSKAVRQQFTQMIDSELKANKKLAEDQRRNPQEVTVLQAAKYQFGA